MLLSRGRSLFRRLVLCLGVALILSWHLLEVSVLPMMVTPILESSMTPALYLVPPIPVLSVNDQVPVLVASSLDWEPGSGYVSVIPGVAYWLSV